MEIKSLMSCLVSNGNQTQYTWKEMLHNSNLI